VEKSIIPEPMKKTVAKKAANAASVMVRPSDIAKGMGKKMCKKMPAKMKEKGLTVVMEEVYREGPYIVLELQVQHVDTVAIENSQREENADLTQDDDANSSSVAGALLEWSLKLIGRGNQQKLEGDFLPKKVQDKLQTEMMNMMAEKFEEKRLEADVEIIKEEKQARFFYSKLREVRAVMEEQKGTNPLKELRKKMKKDENDDDDDSDDSF
jgi:hypothetical protein